MSKLKFSEMFDFIVQINEVFDTKINDIDWKNDKNVLIGSLKINDEDYQILLEPGEFKYKDEKFDFINVSFMKLVDGKPSTNITLNNKSASKVIGAIINGIHSKIGDYNFDALTFGATDSIEKRMNIYNWIARKYLKKLGTMKQNIKLQNGVMLSIVFDKKLDPYLDEFIKFLEDKVK